MSPFFFFYSRLPILRFNLFGQEMTWWAGIQIDCEHTAGMMQWLEEFRGWGEKVGPSGMGRVKLFKSILLTPSDSQSNTFLIHKANGQRRQRLRLINEGLWDSAAVEWLQGQRHVSNGPRRAGITMKGSVLLT